jgi:HPt (histidine-containing phosphotransfer) domain-containing protein
MTEVVIDTSELRKLLDVIGGDREEFQELLDEYVATAPELIESIRAGVAGADLDKTRIAAHTLKSNSRDFGATKLAKLSEELEHACKAGSLDGTGATLAAIATEVVAVCTKLGEMNAEDL